MESAKILKSHIWLMNTIRKARRITLKEIQEKWNGSTLGEEQTLSRTTFNRYRENIEDIWGVRIGCDCNDHYRYFIENPEILEGDTFQKWLFSTISVCNVIEESFSLQDRILFEDVPSQGEALGIAIDAMKQCLCLSITYRKYRQSEAHSIVVAPYCLKIWNQRWYLLARIEGGEYRVFSFDRISAMTITDTGFVLDPAFDAKYYFAECYGVVSGDGSQVERIRLRAYGRSADYLRDLPLHHSQEEVATYESEKEEESYTDFELRMRPTSDFKAYLLSRGHWVKVLSPQGLAEEIRQMHLKAAGVL